MQPLQLVKCFNLLQRFRRVGMSCPSQVGTHVQVKIRQSDDQSLS